jgi:hypothetical protein
MVEAAHQSAVDEETIGDHRFLTRHSERLRSNKGALRRPFIAPSLALLAMTDSIEEVKPAALRR